MTRTVLDRQVEQKRLEASAVVASRVSRLHLRAAMHRITRRELAIIAIFAVALVLVVLWFNAQNDHARQELRDQRAADRETIKTFSDQLRVEQGLLLQEQQESRAQLKLINQLRRKLIKLGVNPKSIPALPAIPTVTTFPGFTSGAPTSGGRAAGGPSRPPVSNPSSSGSAGRPNPTPTPTPTPTPSPTPKPSHTPIIDVPPIRVGGIELPPIKVG